MDTIVLNASLVLRYKPINFDSYSRDCSTWLMSSCTADVLA